ncbi:MAG: putative rRNA maturation factor YbeY [Rhodobacteraceae bacterium HLUCCA08]|nr:MAG: putative rRNA maturation factor YbeY [Rhodobacteraceae bacterium HLUCCA08]
MSIDVLIEAESWSALDLAALAERAEAATLERLGLEPAAFEIALLACDDARIAALNADFRGKPQPTNVLSWPSEDRGAAGTGEMPLPPDPADPELGDIAIAWETCAREAAEAGKPLADHVTHLTVHGILHLLGFDHERDADAALMEGLEVEILGKLGLSDPY